MTHLDVAYLIFVYFRMSENVELDQYHCAYTLSCLGGSALLGLIGLEEAWLGDEKAVYTDSFDGLKWVYCNGCKKCYHLSCVTSDTEQQVEARGWPLLCTFN